MINFFLHNSIIGKWTKRDCNGFWLCFVIAWTSKTCHSLGEEVCPALITHRCRHRSQLYFPLHLGCFIIINVLGWYSLLYLWKILFKQQNSNKFNWFERVNNWKHLFYLGTILNPECVYITVHVCSNFQHLRMRIKLHACL